MPYKKIGSALISALFIMTLVAIAATAMSVRLQQDIYRAQMNIDSDKLYLASQAVTEWAMNEISGKKSRFTALDSEGKVREFPQHLEHIYPGVTIKGELFDLQAKFNINNIQNKKFRISFYNLLENSHAIQEENQRKSIFDATIQWIEEYKPGRGKDKLLSWYLKQKPPYYPGYQPMQNISEFRLVYGVTAPVYRALLPYLTALPEVTPVNIKTAPLALLMSLGNGLSEAQAMELMQVRSEKKFNSEVNEIIKKLDLPKEQITTESNYFLSVATTSLHDHQLTVYTVIKCAKNQSGKLIPGILYESLNTI
jgi:general secretion pathway protein K